MNDGPYVIWALVCMVAAHVIFMLIFPAHIQNAQDGTISWTFMVFHLWTMVGRLAAGSVENPRLLPLFGPCVWLEYPLAYVAQKIFGNRVY